MVHRGNLQQTPHEQQTCNEVSVRYGYLFLHLQSFYSLWIKVAFGVA